MGVQDTRGRFKSGGAFSPLRAEANDTLNTAAWIKTLPWVRADRSGMYGYSYSGWLQLLAAAKDGTPFAALSPGFCSAGFYNLGYTHGVVNVAFTKSYASQIVLMEATWSGERGTNLTP